MLNIEGLTIRYEGAPEPAVDDLSIVVAEGETVVLLGPSGCGKTSVLRAVAGLEVLERGSIALDGKDITDTPTHKRGLGFMFQDLALFSHRDVAGNIEFGLRMQGLDRSRRRERVAEMLELVGLPGWGGRTVTSLSGGERQRVALARALAPSPRLLMLDEPLSSLDATLRRHLVDELHDLFGRLGVSVLYVTHDQSEAFTLADHLVIMDRGQVIQQGEPLAVWRAPTDEFVANFLGMTNVIDAELAEVVTGDATRDHGPTGNLAQSECLLIRPEAMRITTIEPAGPAIKAHVERRVFKGDHVVVHLVVDDTRAPDPLHLVVPGTPDAASIDPSTTVWVAVDPDGIIPLRSPHLPQSRSGSAR